MKSQVIYSGVFIIGMLLYINTIPNNYAYDDYSVVRDNKFTVKGISGIPGHLFYDSFYGFTDQKNLFRGGRYRPLSLITLSVEYEIFGENPHISHLINVILFGLICVLLLRVMSALFIEDVHGKNLRYYFTRISFVSVLIFAVHPIHTEVVANIKGRDELMALLFALLSWRSVLLFVDRKKNAHLMSAGIFFFLSLLSKESAAPLLVLMILSVYCFRSKVVFRASIIKLTISLVASFTVFVILRQTVIGWDSKPSMPDNILSNSFMFAKGFSERYGTTFYTIGLYLKLLIFPHPLTIDYYPFFIPYVELSSWKAILPLIVFVIILVAAVVLTYKKNIAGFGLFFFFATFLPVSNLAFPVGPFMGERFMFIPSLGIIITLVWILIRIAEKFRIEQYLSYFFILTIVMYSLKTFSRNFDWKDNFTLYTTDVKTSVNSAIITRFAGQELLIRMETERDSVKIREYSQLAVQYLEKAEKLNKSTTETVLLGNAYCNTGEYEKALGMYSETLKMNKDYNLAYGNYLIAVEKLPSPHLKLHYYDQLISIVGDKFDPYYLKGFVYGKQLNNVDSAVIYLNSAYRIDSTNVDCLSALGVVYAMKGELKKSLFYLEKGYRINPADKNIVNNMIVTLTNLGDHERVRELTKGH